jgi:DNA-binding transcriptional ArsR family regulator
MPPRKAEQIVEVLRQEILSGQRAPGAKLPTYDAFVEQFGVTRPTVARGMKALRREGLVTADGTRGVFVAKTFPHHTRYLWVTDERPGTPAWSGLSAALLALIERGQTGLAGEVVPLLGVDGRASNPGYATLCDALAHGSAAGLILTSATTRLLPALETAGLPRVCVGEAQPHAAILQLEIDALIDGAAARLAGAGRVAVLSPEVAHLERARASFRARGLAGRLLQTWHVAPVGCEAVTRLLFERSERPDALLVTDDGLVAGVLAGLEAARVRPRRDVRVVARCHWPCSRGDIAGVEAVGFDAREILAAAKESLDAQREGGYGPRVVSPKFATDELMSSVPQRGASPRAQGAFVVGPRVAPPKGAFARLPSAA